jgi:hypothetical protein
LPLRLNLKTDLSFYIKTGTICAAGPTTNLHIMLMDPD